MRGGWVWAWDGLLVVTRSGSSGTDCSESAKVVRNAGSSPLASDLQLQFCFAVADILIKSAEDCSTPRQSSKTVAFCSGFLLLISEFLNVHAR